MFYNLKKLFKFFINNLIKFQIVVFKTKQKSYIDVNSTETITGLNRQHLRQKIVVQIELKENLACLHSILDSNCKLKIFISKECLIIQTKQMKRKKFSSKDKFFLF